VGGTGISEAEMMARFYNNEVSTPELNAASSGKRDIVRCDEAAES